MKPNRLIKQVFLSCTQKDRNLAAAITRALSAHEIPVWNFEQIAAAADWRREITRALSESDAMIALLDPHSFSSSSVRAELFHALFDERYKNRVLPVLLRGATRKEFSRLPWILMQLHFLELRGHSSIAQKGEKVAEAFIQLLDRPGGEW